ncbi:hypothetical protein KC340_g18634 [Hortaea werneckii]|nr:hypothetical protein KC342_g18101 [Hortaea werneckii]KAI7056454.1 hypothetical protein KC339_g18169 [Hortaea werneckii]KAI7201546.1 hypothetical protein KC365_g18704 [Hortaea werneckii]KAI7282748.1 hypothetical protein KC340_g18634 [Hortaea werneckii]KAI7373117.1 hypothetical protein KC328_g16817 [Hortaea werneckii]
MAAPRSVQFIALRNLSRGSHQVRRLHMTGPSEYASPLLTQERPALSLPRDIAGLRAECRRRKIEATGHKQDLISRITAHEVAHSRAFSSAVEQTKRPTPAEPQQQQETPSQIIRHFNTSRELKQPKDTSTMDFAYFPDLDPDNVDANLAMRVPIIPDNYSPPRTGAHAPEVEEMVVVKPQIVTASADAVYLPMADLSDGHAMNVDFHSMADRVATNLRRMRLPVEQQAGMMKQLWSDMIDDLFGVGGGGVAGTGKTTATAAAAARA